MTYNVTFDYQDAYAELSVWDDNETATLKAIASKFRKRGAGRIVLSRALQYADFLGLTVVLEVVPFGDGVKMSAPELKAFYMSVGFSPTTANTMSRPPSPIKE